MSCIQTPVEPDFNNPHDEEVESYEPPGIESLNIVNEQIISSRDLKIEWKGNYNNNIYTYILDYGTPNQLKETFINLIDLDEGKHILSLKACNSSKCGEPSSLTFYIDAIPEPGIVFSPRRITENSQINLNFDGVNIIIGAHIEIVCSEECVDFGNFALNDTFIKDYQLYSFSDTLTTSRLILDIACLEEQVDLSGLVEIGSFYVIPKSSGEIFIDPDNTFFRDMDNQNIGINGLDIVKVVK